MGGPDPLPDREQGQRKVRSFVLRSGRLTAAQERALNELWPDYGLDFTEQPLDLEAVFGRRAPLVVEVGFGNGDALAWMAGNEPDRNFIGIEVHPPGVGAALQKVHHNGLNNARIIAADAIPVLQQMFAPDSIDELRLYFPDPWPKKRHHKRRIVQAPFLDLLAQRLHPEGRVHMATDWEPYAEWMRDELEQHPQFTNASPDGEAYMSRPEWRPETHFERRGRRLGHGVWDLLYRRVCSPA